MYQHIFIKFKILTQKYSPPISELMLIAPTQLEVLPVNVTLVMKHGSEIQDAQIMMSVDIPVR